MHVLTGPHTGGGLGSGQQTDTGFGSGGGGVGSAQQDTGFGSGECLIDAWVDSEVLYQVKQEAAC